MKFKKVLCSAITALLVGPTVNLFAAPVELSQDPVFSASGEPIRPNIMFILDDSGSMDWDYMPDYVRDDLLCKGSQCSFGDPLFNSGDFNGVYYNPEVTYTPAVKTDGSTLMANQVRFDGTKNRWDQVQVDPFLNASSKTSVELISDKIYCKSSSSTDDSNGVGNNCRKNGRKYGTTAAGYNYPDGTYKVVKNVSSPPYYYNMTIEWCASDKNKNDCTTSKDGAHPYLWHSNISRVDITTATCPSPSGCVTSRSYDQEMTNYANWYSYYRTRTLMAKTSSGLAFRQVSADARVGFMSIHTTAATNTEYLKIAPFINSPTSSQRTNWFDRLYKTSSTSGTPLRQALSVAGQMYAGKRLDDPLDNPKIAACQKNLAILTTDGYWNGAAGMKIDGTSMGNQDNVNSGFSTRPKYDGNLTGASDTLADVAMYYYKTDLRDTLSNDVSPTQRDPATHQHMTTYTIGLGVSGEIPYILDYENKSLAFDQIENGTRNWPVPAADKLTAVDDLWHAGVNGGGYYYSARDPQTFVEGIREVLKSVVAESGAAAAAATSNPNVISGDNFLFSSTFRTEYWDGELVRQRIDDGNGKITSQIDWSARGLLNAKTGASSDIRKIYMWAGSGTSKMKDFTWANLSDTQKAWFSPALLGQYSGLSVDGKAAADVAGSMIGYLRGQRGLEGDMTKIDMPYRPREHVLGDIVSGEAAYIKTPRFKYKDAGYSKYVTDQESRTPMVYVPANDGMLHAFNAETGDEVWTYIPSVALPRMHKLADKQYQHQFFVDGTPIAGDVYDGTNWRTILVGGFNAGGKGYYALDVTNPSAPIALWEICADASLCNRVHANVGFSYGNPVITKIKGQWSVLLTSGYSNADGNGYLYILDAITGAHRTGSPLTVASSCSGGHCGFAKIAGWVDDPMTNNSTTDVYGGDLDGNLWRVQLDKRIGETIVPAAPIVTLLAELRGGGIPPQPITTKPALGEFDKTRIIMVGTGRLLATSDISVGSKEQQTFYGIRDPLKLTGWGQVRGGNELVEQKFIQTTTAKGGLPVLTTTTNLVDWKTKAGWYVDFLKAGERVTGDPVLALGTVAFTTNIPTTTVESCRDRNGGQSYFYALNFRTGTFVTSAAATAISGSAVAGTPLGDALATRPVVLKLPDGKAVAIITLSTGTGGEDGLGKETEEHPYTKGFKGRRSSWREVIIQ